MTHIILGKGNLGQALNRSIYRNTKQSPAVSHREKVVEIKLRFEDNENTWIWVTEGFGSVGECKKDSIGAFDLHVRKTFELIQKFPKSNIVFFSTNYVADENNVVSSIHPKHFGSEYANSKALMENVIRFAQKNKPNVWPIRVANLYSKYSPWNSFAGRLIKAREAGDVISLPENLMLPTDTDWLADRLVDNMHKFKEYEIMSIVPTGAVSTKKFGELILGETVGLGKDIERPMNARMFNTFPHHPNWIEVWNAAVEYRKALDLPELTNNAI